MKFAIITAFPDSLGSMLSSSILYMAQKNKLVDINIINIRDYGIGSRQYIDDRPFGGGAGMVMMAEPLYQSIYVARKLWQEDMTLGEYHSMYWEKSSSRVIDVPPVVFLTPHGEMWKQELVEEYHTSYPQGIILVCGHYEGIDERIRERLIDREISLGCFVLSGGEIPALAVVDSISRLVSGVLGNAKSHEEESHSMVLGRDNIEYPHYTRPEEYRGDIVPDVLLSGHHTRIEQWRSGNVRKK